MVSELMYTTGSGRSSKTPSHWVHGPIFILVTPA